MNSTEGITLLIVEDEIITATLIKKRMADLKLQICGIATSGEEAVNMARLSKPDIILMDIRLSGPIDGIEAAWKIAASTGSRIIFITGYIDEYIKNEAGKLNPLAFLSKPVNFDKLNKIIKTEFSI